MVVAGVVAEVVAEVVHWLIVRYLNRSFVLCLYFLNILQQRIENTNKGTNAQWKIQKVKKYYYIGERSE